MTARREVNGRRHPGSRSGTSFGFRQSDPPVKPWDAPPSLDRMPQFFREHHSAEVENATFRASAANERLSREARRAIISISLLAAIGGLIVLGVLAINEARPTAAPKVDFGAIASSKLARSLVAEQSS